MFYDDIIDIFTSDSVVFSLKKKLEYMSLLFQKITSKNAFYSRNPKNKKC